MSSETPTDARPADAAASDVTPVYSPSDDLPQADSALAQDEKEYETMVREAASAGQLLTAIEVARDALARFGRSRPIQQQLALALAQTGALTAARAALNELLKDSANDVETLCLIGRVYKELWRHAASPADAAAAIKESCRYYGDAFARDESYYPGINLAFTLAAAGDLAGSKECARKVAELCRSEIAKVRGSAGAWLLSKLLGKERPPPDATAHGWTLATLAEALVHQNETQEAAHYYRQAGHLFQGRWRDLASMRRQGQEILRFAGQPHDWLDQCFEFPSVVVFSGHIIDSPDRALPRFPAGHEPEVRDEIRRYLDTIKAGFGYSSAAAGADIIFCECLLEREAKVNLVLPCPVDGFKRQSVSPAGPAWERRFHHVLANATSCIIASPEEIAASPSALVYADRIFSGLAALQAQALDLQLKALAVWDGKPGHGAGGTASVVADWRRGGLQPHLISPAPGGGEVAPAAVASGPANPSAPGASAVNHEIKAMLFAEVVNYKRIREDQLPAFVAEFTGALARLIAELPAPPIVADDSGATLNFVFDGLPEAVRLALGIRDWVRQVDWAARGLPAALSVRMFLHAGPVLAFANPVHGRMTCIGAHMTRAAKIGHVTPPGQVYASQEFAALCGAEQVADLSFEFIGHASTAQLYDRASLYRIGRTQAGGRMTAGAGGSSVVVGPIESSIS